jgi:molybdate transport repressor ModE-like protein
MSTMALIGIQGKHMSARIQSIRAYKDITLQQLRSFCETVRVGSLTAAADSLGLARPTVWKQVHALERHLGMQLLEPHARGCRPTQMGSALAKMASPLVTGIGSLKEALEATLTTLESHVKLAATPRLFLDDLPPCVREFERRFPHTRLTLNEMNVDQVAVAVTSELADIGLAASGPVDDDTWLLYEPCYELDMILVTPTDHPLARKRRVRAADLADYALVNSPSSFADAEMCRRLEKLRLSQTQPRRVEASSYAAIRRYVALGYGIGLVAVSVLHQRDPSFHERSMSHELGRLMVYSIQRRGALEGEAHREFLKIARAKLTYPSSRARSR